jgi:putative Mg2+ transporter-C (MgtC) family protein
MTTTMPIDVTWPDVALRLGLAVAAGLIVGYDRSEHGRPVGLRTTLLVCMAAAVAMIYVNLFLHMTGKPPDSFVTIDPMRMPLGILTGMGFIGGGAILRRGPMVSGVTTAATLWMVTIIGLCFGGGQLALGSVALALCYAALSGLKWFEFRMIVDRSATLSIICTDDGPTEEEIRQMLSAEGLHVETWDVTYVRTTRRPRRLIHCTFTIQSSRAAPRRPNAVDQLAHRPGVTKIRWQM